MSILTKTIIDRIFGQSEVVKNEYLYQCPKCNHHRKKLSVNFEKLKFKCWVCEPHFRGNLEFLVKRYGTYDELKQYRLEHGENNTLYDFLYVNDHSRRPKQIISLPDEYEFALKNPTKELLDWFKDKDILEEDIYRWKIGVCYQGRYWGRVIFPSFDTNGNCDFFYARSFSGKHDPRFEHVYSDTPKTELVFNELFIDWNAPVYITEGIRDAFKIPQNAIPLFGKTLSESSLLLERLIVYAPPKICLCLDTDRTKKGLANRSLELYEFLSQYSIESVIIKTYPYKDLGEIPRAEIVKFLTKEVKIRSQTDLLREKLELM